MASAPVIRGSVIDGKRYWTGNYSNDMPGLKKIPNNAVKVNNPIRRSGPLNNKTSKSIMKIGTYARNIFKQTNNAKITKNPLASKGAGISTRRKGRK